MALMLLGLLVAIAIPSFNALVGTHLRKAVNQMQGLMRDVYMKAALSGKTHRIVFDLDHNQYWVESSEGQVTLGKGTNQVGRQGEGSLLSDDEKRLIDRLGDDVKGKGFLLTPSFQAVDGELGKKQSLPSGVRFAGVWADNLDDRVRKGKAAVYFFPGGSMQNAQVSLSLDNGKDLTTLVGDPLTGKAVVENGEPEIEK